MRVLTLTELMRMTRIELCDLAARITNALPGFPETSVEYANARINLRNIHRVLTRRDTGLARSRAASSAEAARLSPSGQCNARRGSTSRRVGSDPCIATARDTRRQDAYFVSREPL